MTDWRDAEARAAAWVAEQDRHQGTNSWGPEREAALQAWLAESTAHRVAYLRLQSAWRRADRLSATRTPVQAVRSSSARRRPMSSLLSRLPRPGPSAWAGLAVAVLGVAIGLGTIFWPAANLQTAGAARPVQAHVTEKGGRSLLSMADGSRLTLNTATRLRTALSPTARAVWLDEGEAHFEISHDARRPFVVHAGAQRVMVLGTRFSVRRDGERLRVTVVEGRVQLQVGPGQRATELTRGDLAVSDPHHVVVARRSPRQMQDELAWLEGKLVFDQASLAEVAREFNRYNTRQLLIDDETAAQIRLGGAFDARNVEGFARLLHTGFGLQVRMQADHIKVASPAR
jgi:transmembrane sensor